MVQRFLMERRTKKDIMNYLSVDERDARRWTARMARDYALIAISDADKPGYKIATKRTDYADVQRAYQEDLSRIKKINARQKQRRIFMQLVESGATDEELKAHYNLEENI